jgi:hypothetical protein
MQGNATPLLIKDGQIFFGKEKVDSIRLVPHEEKHRMQLEVAGSSLELLPGLVFLTRPSGGFGCQIADGCSAIKK